MDAHAKWIVILAKAARRKQLPLDIEHCSPIALRTIILDVRTPDSILEQIAHIYYDNEEILRDLVRCPNLSETTLAFIALTASDEIKGFISGTRAIELIVGDDSVAEDAADGKKKKLNMTQAVQLESGIPPQGFFGYVHSQ